MSKTIDKYILNRPVGQGQYGKVYEGYNMITKEIVAIKVIKLSRFKQVPKLTQFTINEVNTLKKIDNPNVIKFIELISSSNNLYLVYQYCNGGNLEEYIQKRKYLSEMESLEKFMQILNAFESLVKENIIHRDLKPSNILLHDNQIKVADFGFCKTVSKGDLTQTMVGSPIYMAPEILLGEPYQLSADIWSLGVCLFEMLFGKCPYEDVTIQNLMFKIQNTQLLIPRNINPISEGLERLLRKMLNPDPRGRISWSDLFQLRPPPPQIPPPQPQLTINVSRPARSKSPISRNNDITRQISPTGQITSPYQQIFQKKPSSAKIRNTGSTYASESEKSDTFAILNIKQILEWRQLIQQKLTILIKLLELNETFHMPIIALYLIKSIDQELKLDQTQMLRWNEFQNHQFYDLIKKLTQEDRILLTQLQSHYKMEGRKIHQEEISYDVFLWNSKKYLKILNGDLANFPHIKEFLILLKKMGLEIQDPAFLNQGQIQQLILNLSQNL
ncbi:hypothetical protein pb186bvf_012613 [Paramecium bursaria]